jgi:hypothetical protein
LSLNFIIGFWDYTLDRQDKVSGETSLESRDRGKNDIETENECGRQRGETRKLRRILGKTRE